MPQTPTTDYSTVGITCLNCGQVQLPPNRDTLDNWSCGYCHSGWLSIAMLSNLAPRELVKTLSTGGKKGAGRGCPHCKRKMHDVPTSVHGKDVHFEVCRKCRIVWFDSGELLRGLRYRAPENTVSEEASTPVQAAQPTPRPKQRATAPKKPAPLFVARYTYALVLLCLCLMPLAARYPELVARFGFLPEFPFRGYGLTWLASVFLHEQASSLLVGMVLLLLAGGYAEEKLGSDRYLALFLTAGIAGRVAFALTARHGDALYVGSTSAVAGVVTYAALVFPYRRVLFPENDRWRSPINGVMWGVVVLVCAYGLYVGYNFIAAALHQVAHGSDAPGFVDSHLKELRDWLDRPTFRGLAAGMGIGVLWSLISSMSDYANRPVPAPPSAPTPLRKTRLHM